MHSTMRSRNFVVLNALRLSLTVTVTVNVDRDFWVLWLSTNVILFDKLYKTVWLLYVTNILPT